MEFGTREVLSGYVRSSDTYLAVKQDRGSRASNSMITRPSNSTYISRCVNVDSRLHWRSVARRTCQLRHASIICIHAIVWGVSPRDRSRRTGRCGVNTRSSAPSSKQPNSMSDPCSHARPGGQGSDLEICVYHGIWPGRRCTRSPAPRPSSQTWSVTARAAAT